mgnify:FL=1
MAFSEMGVLLQDLRRLRNSIRMGHDAQENIRIADACVRRVEVIMVRESLGNVTGVARVGEPRPGRMTK